MSGGDVPEVSRGWRTWNVGSLCQMGRGFIAGVLQGDVT